MREVIVLAERARAGEKLDRNERWGHAVGDRVLAAAADILRDGIRAGDLAARLGGDEFAVLLDGVSGLNEAIEVAQRLLDDLRREPPPVEGAPAPLASFGIALTATGVSGDDALHQAYAALYAAKANGKGRLEVYDDLHADALSAPSKPARGRRDADRRAELEALLERDGSIEIVFQPIVDVRDAAPAGYEALARFPDGRAPDAWFREARRAGLGPRLEAAAIRAALLRPGRPPGAYLALNVSPTALTSEDVQSVLPEDLSGIVIEITEHELVVADEQLRENLADVRRRGGRVAVDDAGTGYAGLSQLTQLRPDIVKLDRALVDGVAGDQAKASLIEAFVRFSRRIGASVCAEGVERFEDLRLLADLDVAYGQGYALARPASPWADAAADALDLLRAAVAASRSPVRADSGFGDRVLEVVSAKLSGARDVSEFSAAFPAIARCLHADALDFSRLAGDRLDTVDPATWTTTGESYALDRFPTSRHALTTHEIVQVRAGDPHADAIELDLLRAIDDGAYRSLLLIPVLARGSAVGLLEAYCHADRAWTREEISRARIIAYQLGHAVARLDEPAPLDAATCTIADASQPWTPAVRTPAHTSAESRPAPFG